ncbi:TetR/AcrR family transcriptional regulator [Rhodococcus sp. ABRD24]|uniref:TetR/AcrR family transcriptional regulator n=1 Tax=Rhodococcus sp. ABRD24 TaxID=2507582 RepID=UPI00103EB286|nr:TetR/AcrR family transcriptional regulator [Rhodococcus sp. ABRD24]QBJ96350.1 TetR/AcrR family transcriptional regulator [Rhodococcus sp. ABRD24]
MKEAEPQRWSAREDATLSSTSCPYSILVMRTASADGRARTSFIEAARRAQIIDSTISVVAESGYKAASFTRIAKHASISPGLITYHFEKKEALMRAVLETVEARLDAAMAEPSEAGHDDSYPAALEGMLTRFVQYCARDGDQVSAMTEIRRQIQVPEIHEAVAISGRSGTAELVSFVEEGQSYGQFRDVDAALYVSVLTSGMGEVPGLLRGREPDQIDAFAEQWSSLYVRAIVAADTATAPAGRRPVDK